MDIEEEISKYRLYKCSTNNNRLFIRESDDNTIDAFIKQHNGDDLVMSACLYDEPEYSAQKSFDLRFHVTSENPEILRTSTLEVCYYISENFCIPEDSIEIIYIKGCGDFDKSNLHSSKITETIILISPVVFTKQPMPLTPVINYQLARELIDDGLNNINIDVYQKDYFIPLTNSMRNGRYVISLTQKELLYLNEIGVAKLSEQPRAENRVILPQYVPEAAEWFNEQYHKEEKEQYKQSQLQKLILEKGWQIPPCLRRLTWTELSEEQAFETCRIISQFYSWLKASSDEIWHHFQKIERRNQLKDYLRMRAIIGFAIENPEFVGCQHPILKQYCPGICFMQEIMKKYEQPNLFR